MMKKFFKIINDVSGILFSLIQMDKNLHLKLKSDNKKINNNNKKNLLIN